jgi:ABC-2 type transport system permease protein
MTSVIYKEVFHVLRDPKTLFLMLLIPGTDMTVFGYAIDLEVSNISTVVYNLDGRPPSQELLDIFENTGYFVINETANSDEELYNAIVRGDAKLGVKIPPDYTDNLVRKTGATVQVLLDGSDSTVAMQALQVVNAVALNKSLEIIGEELRGGSEIIPVEARARVLFNPDMKTPNFMVPGLVAVIMQVVTMMLTALAIVREKEAGTLEQLMVTPVSRLGLLMGKLIPYAVIGVVETAIVLLIMVFLFGVPITGSVGLLALFSLSFLFTALGMGLLTSTLASNQLQAAQLAFLFILPAILLSGFMFPRESMPDIIFLMGYLIPATYFITILRGIILRGADFWDLWQEALILTIMGVVVISVAASRFRKTVG